MTHALMQIVMRSYGTQRMAQRGIRRQLPVSRPRRCWGLCRSTGRCRAQLCDADVRGGGIAAAWYRGVSRGAQIGPDQGTIGAAVSVRVRVCGEPHAPTKYHGGFERPRVVARDRIPGQRIHETHAPCKAPPAAATPASM